MKTYLEPSSLLVREYAVALMRVTLGVFQGSTGEVGFINSETGSRGFNRGSTDRNILMGGELKDSCCTDCWKEMLPNTQSIEEL